MYRDVYAEIKKTLKFYIKAETSRNLSLIYIDDSEML